MDFLQNDVSNFFVNDLPSSIATATYHSDHGCIKA